MKENVSQWIGFRKKLVKTHVAPRYDLILPKEFCEAHLPSHDDNFILVGESEQKYDVRYSIREDRSALGWKCFVMAHNLREGDTVVFDLIDVCMFKVHIIRSSRNEVQNNNPVELAKLNDIIDEDACIDNAATEKKYPVSCAADSNRMQDRILCRSKKGVQEEVIHKGKMKHVKLSFCKIMHRSNVSAQRQLVLRVPAEFRKVHLPCYNTTIILVDENQREYNVGYWVKKGILLSGWKGFARAHGLKEGDMLVFQLIDPCKFKVYIDSTHRSTRTNGAGTGQIHQVKTEYSVLQSCVTPSLTANQKKRSTETHLVGPKWKVRRQMNGMKKLQCGNILRDLMNHSYGWIFNQPVDPVKLNIPDYFSVISEPMDLGTIKHKLEGDMYSSREEFAADVRLTFSNAKWYNPPGHEVHKWAKLFTVRFDKKWELLEAKLNGQGPTSSNDKGKDSRQSGRTNCQDNQKERKSSVRAIAGKVHTKSPRRSPETDREYNSYPSSCDCPTDDGHKTIVKQEPLAIDVHDTTMLVSDCDSAPLANESDSVEYSEAGLNFKDVKGFEYFKIRVNGKIIDSEISPDIRLKYYQLCCSQQKYIHDSVMKGLNSKLIAAMILEIVNIAAATKAASISTSHHDLEHMVKALKSFQDLGMEVESLCTKIGMLVTYSREHRTVEGLLKLAEIETDRTPFKEKKSNMDKLTGSSVTHGLEEKVDAMKAKREKLCFVFKNVARLTW